MIDFSQNKIALRRREIDDLMDALKNERQELDIAEKVLSRLNGPAAAAMPDADSKRGLPRPEGAPTTFEMVNHALSLAETDGKDGLPISEIISEVRRLYWPGLIGPQITPLIYGYNSKGRLHKTKNGKFKRVQTNETS